VRTKGHQTRGRKHNKKRWKRRVEKNEKSNFDTEFCLF
jgi:hypothetical protein